jgi:hypothetical protein
MRKFLVAMSFVIFAVAVFTAVAYRALVLQRERPKATTISLPLEFSIQLEKVSFQEGEIVNANLTLENTSNTTIELVWRDGRIFDLIVEDVDGTRVWNWQSFHAYPEAVFDKTLSPSKHLSYYYWWDQSVPWEGASGPYPAGQVPKGIYFVKGALSPFSLNVDGHITSESLETPTITITIN